MNHLPKNYTSWLIGIFVYFCSQFVNAENVQQFGNQIPSENDFIEALTPKDPGTMPRIKTRGIRPLQSEFDQANVETPVEVGIGMELGFNFDSATLTIETKSILDNLGGALKSDQFVNAVFRIEGHSDGTGSEDYNLQLSTRRAESVKNYLVKRFDIPAESIKAVGKGEKELLDPANPSSSKNRRVQIVNEVGS